VCSISPKREGLYIIVKKKTLFLFAFYFLHICNSQEIIWILSYLIIKFKHLASEKTLKFGKTMPNTRVGVKTRVFFRSNGTF
jgi:hypothetical protein